jgi:hypothetical protein
MPACPGLALLADAAAGPDETYPGAPDDELTGALCAWDRSESHAHGRKLAAITELRRCRPVIELPASGRTFHEIAKHLVPPGVPDPSRS